jgi:hypothetical protein
LYSKTNTLVSKSRAAVVFHELSENYYRVMGNNEIHQNIPPYGDQPRDYYCNTQGMMGARAGK